MPKKPTYVSFQSEGTDIAMKDDDVEDIEDEDDQHASQDSNSSENNNLENMLSLVAQLRDTRAKKKREAEKKFLKVARTQALAETQQTLDQASLAARTIDEAYTKFTVDYANIEDKIREKWEEIRQEQATLVRLSLEGIHASTTAGQTAEREHIRGMTIMKQACEDMVTIINSVTPATI